MSKVSDSISEATARFIARQHVFFIASAPSGEQGHVNLSPKGLGGFRILGPRQVAYLDYPGSTVETIAHLRENGRVVIMFCAFEGAPKIVRLHGRGRVLEPSDPEFSVLLPQFGVLAAPPRSIIQIELERVSDSCGFSVPLYEYRGQRDTLVKWAKRKGERGLARYTERNNARSIDGLPGLPVKDPRK